jgi:hypothetical protein
MKNQVILSVCLILLLSSFNCKLFPFLNTRNPRSFEEEGKVEAVVDDQGNWDNNTYANYD